MATKQVRVIQGKKSARTRRSHPKPHRRSAVRFVTTAKTVAGHLAMWAVRQSPYPYPDHLGIVIGRLLYQLKKHAKADRRANSLMKATGMFQIDERSLAKLIMKVLCPMREFQRWNDRKNSNPAPFNTFSRYDPTECDPANEFIDLDALTRNVARSVATEEEDAAAT